MASKKTILITVTLLIVTICVCAMTLQMLVLDKPEQQRTYSFEFRGMEPSGYLIDDSGKEKINFATWEGKDSDLYTTWGTSGQYAPVPMPNSAQWLQYTIYIHAEPGTTVKLDQVKITTTPGLIIITEPGEVNPSDYWTSAYVMVNGAKLHSALCTSAVTTDSTGYAEMILIVLTDQWHHYVEIDGDWTCTNIST